MTSVVKQSYINKVNLIELKKGGDCRFQKKQGNKKIKTMQDHAIQK